MKLISVLALSLMYVIGYAQTLGTTILDEDLAQEGYTLLAPLNYNTTYLVNNCGEVINRWISDYPPGDELILDESGNLWRAGRTSGDGLIGAGGRGGIIELFNWDGDVIWSYERCNTEECLHHDFKLLPNGNLLLLVWDAYTTEQAVSQGANIEQISEIEGVWSEYLVEVTPNLEVNNEVTTVWEWHAWEHLVQDFDAEKPNFGVVSDNNKKIDLNYSQALNPDWLHCNGIDYNAELDQIILSIPNFNEFWIVDHALSTEEAQTDAGDLLFRWGNPQAYQSGEDSEQQLFFMHNPHWVPNDLRFGGEIMLFNNRNIVDEVPISTVTVITPSIDNDGNYEIESGQFLPELPSYEFHLPEALYSDKVSGAQIQPNDNILICSGVNGTLQEITDDEELVWEYKIPVNDLGEIFDQGEDPTGHVKWLFRAYKYLDSYEGFEGKDVSPGNPIELNFGGSYCEVNGLDELVSDGFVQIYPNPVGNELNLKINGKILRFEVRNSLGEVLVQSNNQTPLKVNTSGFAPGIYTIQVYEKHGGVISKRFIKV